jgi:hypothetical protein
MCTFFDIIRTVNTEGNQPQQIASPAGRQGSEPANADAVGMAWPTNGNETPESHTDREGNIPKSNCACDRSSVSERVCNGVDTSIANGTVSRLPKC